MTTYSTSLKLELPGDGQQTGTWGQTTNKNIGDLLEQAITGVATIVMLDANYTLTNLNGTLDEARNAVLIVTGTNTAQRDVIAPTTEKLYTIYNNTTGGFSIRIIGASGTGVVIPNGMATQVFFDGTNYVALQNGVPGAFVSAGNLGSSGNLIVDGTSTLSSALTYGGVTLSNSVTGTGSMALSASPTFTGTPAAPTAAQGTNTTQIATTAFVLANSVPSGALAMWATGTAPSGWLLCTGSAVSRSTYAALFAVIGTTFGSGDGSTTFNLPNYTNRMPYGTTVGATGGSADATLVSHTHTASVTDPGHVHTYSPYGPTFYVGTGGSFAGVQGPQTTNTGSATTGISVSNSTEGSSATNANLPPYLGINFIIKT